MKQFHRLLIGTLICSALVLLTSCADDGRVKGYSTDPATNLEALYHILDEGYCYMPEKFDQPDQWRQLYQHYQERVSDDMGEEALFNLMEQFMCELKDGHVNLFSDFDIGRYNGWRESEHTTINRSIRSKYLGDDYQIAGSLYYSPINYNNHQSDSIGLIVCPSFSSSISARHFLATLKKFNHFQGLIFDMRGNGGGTLTNADRLTSFFIDEPTIVGYMSTKTGPGHNDFGELTPIEVKPIFKEGCIRTPMIILTDRNCFSTANSFASYMKGLPNVRLIGDRTGGGGGLPISSELPNGWWLRYSGTRMLNKQKEIIEWGVTPDIDCYQTEADNEALLDGPIELAIQTIKEMHTLQQP